MAINEANCILEKPISFYGSYVMEVMHKKDEVLTQAVVQHLMRIITNLKNEIHQREKDKEAIENVATLNFDLA